MASTPGVKTTELEGEHFHVRFRDPDEFDEIRTPEWASDVAGTVSSGSKVRMGKRRSGDDWVVQSVLVRKAVGKTKAREQARKILDEIEE